MEADYINPWFALALIVVLWAVVIFLGLRANHKLNQINGKIPKPPVKEITPEEHEDHQLREVLQRAQKLPSLFDYDKEVAKEAK
jgi:hypothetical protein